MGSYFSSEPDESWCSKQQRLKYFVMDDIKKGDFKLKSNLKKPLLFERVVKKRNKKLKIKKNGYFIK